MNEQSETDKEFIYGTKTSFIRVHKIKYDDKVEQQNYLRSRMHEKIVKFAEGTSFNNVSVGLKTSKGSILDLDDLFGVKDTDQPIEIKLSEALAESEKMETIEIKIKEAFNSQSTRFENQLQAIYMKISELLKNPKCVGYDNPGINFEIDGEMFFLHKFLSEGTTAKTYSFRNWNRDLDMFDTSSDYVLKIFKDRNKYLDELEIINDIMERINKLNKENKPKEFLRKIDNPYSDCHNAIVYSPRGSRLEKLTKRRVKQMFECVGKLHEIGVIHRDICPNHFFVINPDTIDEQVFLIDYGSAYCMKNNQNNEDAKHVDYNGSVHFASLDILKMLNEGRRFYIPKRRQDIESLIRTIMYIYYEMFLPANKSTDRKYSDVIKFWNLIDESLQKEGHFQFWEDILVKVRNGDLNLEEIINRFDKLFFLDLEDISKKFNSVNL